MTDPEQVLLICTNEDYYQDEEFPYDVTFQTIHSEWIRKLSIRKKKPYLWVTLSNDIGDDEALEFISAVKNNKVPLQIDNNGVFSINTIPLAVRTMEVLKDLVKFEEPRFDRMMKSILSGTYFEKTYTKKYIPPEASD